MVPSPTMALARSAFVPDREFQMLDALAILGLRFIGSKGAAGLRPRPTNTGDYVKDHNGEFKADDQPFGRGPRSVTMMTVNHRCKLARLRHPGLFRDKWSSPPSAALGGDHLK